MGQMHLYVPDEIEKRLKIEAAKKGLSLSKYLQEIVTGAIDRGWPERYFEQLAANAYLFKDFERPPQLPLEERDWSFWDRREGEKP